MIKIKHNFKPGTLLKASEYLSKNDSFSWAVVIKVIKKTECCDVLLLGHKNRNELFNRVPINSLINLFEIVE